MAFVLVVRQCIPRGRPANLPNQLGCVSSVVRAVHFLPDVVMALRSCIGAASGNVLDSVQQTDARTPSCCS